ncbi:hypothetical protein K493DRAFT_312855, partial [Basidiobolus meristosporus CBS 931.73]
MDADAYFKFKEEKEWNDLESNEPATPNQKNYQTFMSIDFDDLQRSLRTLPVSDRLQLESEIEWNEGFRDEEIPEKFENPPHNAKPKPLYSQAGITSLRPDSKPKPSASSLPIPRSTNDRESYVTTEKRQLSSKASFTLNEVEEKGEANNAELDFLLSLDDSNDKQARTSLASTRPVPQTLKKEAAQKETATKGDDLESWLDDML